MIGQHPEGYPCVYYDDCRATYDLTRKVLQKERSRLVFLGIQLQDPAAGRERLRGYEQAVRDAGLPELAERYLVSPVSVEAGAEKMNKALDLFGVPDGVVCAADEIAAGALRCLLDHGIRVPEDTVVAGQGDSELIRAAGHDILTVHYSY